MIAGTDAVGEGCAGWDGYKLKRNDMAWEMVLRAVRFDRTLTGLLNELGASGLGLPMTLLSMAIRHWLKIPPDQRRAAAVEFLKE